MITNQGYVYRTINIFSICFLILLLQLLFSVFETALDGFGYVGFSAIFMEFGGYPSKVEFNNSNLIIDITLFSLAFLYYVIYKGWLYKHRNSNNR